SGFGYVPGGLVTGVWMGNNNQEPMSNSFQGVFSADGPLKLWQSYMQIALNQPWDWNGQQAFPQTTFPQPAGIVNANVCRFSGMAATRNCGPTQTMPFLEGTVPPPDNVHSDGCFDVVQEIAQDSRRPPEWVTSAKTFADRLVNDETSAVGDPTKLKENPKYRLLIGPVLGNTGFGGPLCGDLKATPTPEITPEPSGGGGGPNSPKPQPSCKPKPGRPTCPPVVDGSAGASSAGTDAGLAIPFLGVSTLLSLVPLAGRVRTRRRRRH
ncbi:MAG TPA: hypothetical protein VK838_06725, partial [Candidatus Limnocylindrales bacterium]|nr:hypothetical protein [Candidatus Limnocylindrales bacterium]